MGIAILAIITLVAYSYNQLSIDLNEVRLRSIDLEPISLSSLLNLDLGMLTENWLDVAFDFINGVNLDFIFNISNNGLFPVYIPDLTYDIMINDVLVGKGYSKADMTINPGQSAEISSFQNIQKSSLSPIVYSIIDSKGIMNVKVSGTAHLKMLGQDIPIPFESSKQISIYEEIRDKFNFG